MWYVIIGIILLLVICQKKQSEPVLSFSMHVDNSILGREKAKALIQLKGRRVMIGYYINNSEILTNSLIHFKILSNLKNGLKSSIIKIFEQLEDDKAITNESCNKIADSITDLVKSMIINGLILIDFDEESDFNIDNLKKIISEKVKSNIREIEKILVRMEKSKQKFEFNIPAVDKKINSIKDQIEEFSKILNDLCD